MSVGVFLDFHTSGGVVNSMWVATIPRAPKRTVFCSSPCFWKNFESQLRVEGRCASERKRQCFQDVFKENQRNIARRRDLLWIFTPELQDFG